MIFKVFLTGMTVVSLCMANISGIVTDTGKTPIGGAAVHLEKGGQTVTTGADGRFTLVIGGTGTFPGNGKQLPRSLSAGITGNLMTVTTSEQSIVEVTAFNITGKSLSTVHMTLDAGSHSISLPYLGSGIYLYKVKSGNSEFTLMGNSVNKVLYENSVLSKVSSSDHLAEQAKATMVISDVNAATKAGWLNYRCVIGNSDTSGVVIKMIANAGDVTDTDGNVYQSVRIGNQVWMTENLRVTKYNDGTAIPKDTSSVGWYDTTTPKYCFQNNTAIPESIKKYGALYNWYVVSPANPKKIAPVGWHVPTDAEWDTLQNYLIAKGYNWDGTTTDNRIAKALAAKADWLTYPTNGTIGSDLSKNNSSGFSALGSGSRGGIADGSFYGKNGNCYWWSATESSASFACYRLLDYSIDYLYRDKYRHKSCGFSVRLLRD